MQIVEGCSSIRRVFVIPECKVLLQDWMLVTPNLILLWEELIIDDCSMYFSSCLTKNSGPGVDASMRKPKTRAIDAGVKHLESRYDISLELKGCVHCNAVR